MNFEKPDPKLLSSTNVKTGPALQIEDEEEGRGSKEGQSIDLSNESINDTRKPEREGARKKSLTVKFSVQPDEVVEEDKRRAMSPSETANEESVLVP